MDAFTIVQNDVQPALQATLAYADGSPLDLAGTTVNLVLKNVDATSTYLNVTCLITGPSTVTYQWLTSDTATPGNYVGEFIVTFGDSTTQSFPTDGYFSVTITPALTGSTKPRPTYLTTQELINQTRLYLDGRIRPGRNKLDSAVGPTDDTLVFRYDVAGAAPGMVLTIGLETVYVWDAAGKTLTVERGVDGTIPASHAAGDTILLSPEWTDARILTALNLELTSLPSQGVYPVKALDLQLTADTTGYDLAADVVKVLDVRWQDRCDPTQWTPVESFEVARDMPAAQFPSGIALLLPQRPFIDPYLAKTSTTNALRVRYRTTFGTLTTLFDDVLEVTSIPESAVDILPMGAALKLMSGRAISHVGTAAQTDPRTSAETHVSDVLNAAARLKQDHDKRVQDEADKISSEWTYRIPTRRLMGDGYGFRRWGWR